MSYYAVKTTGIYCRTGCKSRAPLPKNVVYFDTPAQAERARYRPCKRCRPNEPGDVDKAAFVQLCRLIGTADDAPTLAQLAEMAHMSRFHLQRRFKAAIGVSPKQYAQTIKREREAAAAKRRSAMAYTIVDSALGKVLIAASARGICRVDIASAERPLQQRLRALYPAAVFDSQDAALASAASLLVAYLAGTGPWPQLPLDVRATAFQARVWEALRTIAPGSTRSYAQLAAVIGSPRAARAVARACASNPVALLIPCHRILPQSGGVGGYRWDPARKERLLELERRSVRA